MIGKTRKYVSNASGYPPDGHTSKSVINNNSNSSNIGKSRSFVSTASAYPPDTRQINSLNIQNMNELNNTDSCDSKSVIDSDVVDSAFEECKIQISLENYPKITTDSDSRHVYSMQLSEASISNQYSAFRSNGDFIDTNAQLLHSNASSNEYIWML